VNPKPGTRNELSQRLHLLSPLAPRAVTTELSFPVPASATPVPPGRGIVVNPGGRLGWRRVPPSTFAAAAQAALQEGHVPWVTWGPGEEALARQVVSAAPGAVLAPPTSLGELAAWMKAAGGVICNNTGPMHLAVAVGAPVLAFFFKMDCERWGYTAAPNRMVDLTQVGNSEAALAERARAETTGFLHRLGR
jgi:heptosyltransferase-3